MRTLVLIERNGLHNLTHVVHTFQAGRASTTLSSGSHLAAPPFEEVGVGERDVAYADLVRRPLGRFLTKR